MNGNRVIDVMARAIESFGESINDTNNGLTVSQDLEDGNRAYQTRFVINANFPSVTILSETPNGLKETIFGPIQDRPHTCTRAVKSTTISGDVLLKLTHALFYADAA